MAKRKKHPKLPNGFGSIKKLSGNRTNPYAVYPPTTEFAPNGSPKTPPALCYVSDWYIGFYALMEFRNGTFDAEKFVAPEIGSTAGADDIISKIIAAYNSQVRNEVVEKTFEEIYNEFFEYKYVRDKTREYSKSSINCTKAGFRNCSALHKRSFRSLTTSDLQNVIDECQLKHASKEHIVNLFNQMYDYADANNLCDKKYSDYVKINTPDDDEQGEPFSDTELNTIWQHAPNNTVLQGILIMIYSGYRIAAYKKLQINSEEKFFKGGVKTRAGKGRIVPFCDLITEFVKPDMELFSLSPERYRILFTEELSLIGITGHTPHDCRHTFSWLCDKYKVDGLSKKMMLGHALGSDVTDAKYGHRTLDELRREINKIKR